MVNRDGHGVDVFPRRRRGGFFWRREFFLMEHSGTFGNIPEHFRSISGPNARLDGTFGPARWVRFSPARKWGHEGTSGDIRRHLCWARGDIWRQARRTNAAPLSRGTP